MVECPEERDSVYLYEYDSPTSRSRCLPISLPTGQQRHSYDSTLIIKLNQPFSFSALAGCVTFTDGWNVF